MAHHSRACDNRAEVSFGTATQLSPELGLLSEVVVNGRPVREVIRDCTVDFFQRQEERLKLYGLRTEAVLKRNDNRIQRNPTRNAPLSSPT